MGKVGKIIKPKKRNSKVNSGHDYHINSIYCGCNDCDHIKKFVGEDIRLPRRAQNKIGKRHIKLGYLKIIKYFSLIFRLILSIFNFTLFKEISCILNRYEIWSYSTDHSDSCNGCPRYNKYKWCKQSQKLKEEHSCSDESWSELYRKNPKERRRLFFKAWIQDTRSAIIPYFLFSIIWGYVHYEWIKLGDTSLYSTEKIILTFWIVFSYDTMVIMSLAPFYLIGLLALRNGLNLGKIFNGGIHG